MQPMPTNLTVNDFLTDLESGRITINRTYQRSDGVWPDPARSYLIETVLLNYPIPKMYLHAKIDVTTGKGHKELVDGQQRASALRDFRGGRFALSSVVDDTDLRGLHFDDLSLEQKMTFLNYSLSFDELLGADETEVRQVFRRINSYTVPLNPQEQRHADFQGCFKWFIHRLGLRFNEAWIGLEVFTPKQIMRMHDAKLLSEICHAMCFGIKTTNKRALDRLYRDFDADFPRADVFTGILQATVDRVLSLEDLRGCALMKPLQMYSLVLALSHIHTPIDALASVYAPSVPAAVDWGRAVQHLIQLASLVDADEESNEAKHPFARASRDKTNTAQHRTIRFEWMCRAIAEPTL